MTKALAPIIGVTFFIQIIIFLLGLTNSIILSRWLGPEMFGVLATVIVLVEVIYKAVNPGLDTSALYFISNKRFPIKKYLGNYFLSSLGIFIIAALIITLVSQVESFPFLINVIDINLISSDFWVIIIYFLAFQFYEYGIKIPLGLQKFTRFNLLQALKPAILFILLILCSTLFDVRLWLVLLLISISWMIPAVVIWLNQLPFELRLDKEITKSSLGYGVKVMLGNLLQFFIYRADIILIGFFISQTAVGWYYVSVLIAERLLFLTQATSTILLPAASSSSEQHQKTPLLSRVNLFVVLASSIIVAATAPWIIPLAFSNEYSNSVLPLIVLLPGIASLSISKILSADFGAKGLPQYSMYVSGVNFCLNIILNIYFIPRIGIVGAALSSSISYTAAMILQCYFYKRFTNTPIRELILLKSEDFKSLKKI